MGSDLLRPALTGAAELRNHAEQRLELRTTAESDDDRPTMPPTARRAPRSPVAERGLGRGGQGSAVGPKLSLIHI